MAEIPEEALFSGVSVDLVFRDRKPGFGDVFAICGYVNPNFPPTGRFDFGSLADLHFSQVDDYFGVQATSDEGDDVPIWLYPLVGGRPVTHHAGPFDALRLEYNVLRNPQRRAEHFLEVVRRMVSTLSVNIFYRTRGVELDPSEVIQPLRSDIELIERHWLDSGMVPGSQEALEVDY